MFIAFEGPDNAGKSTSARNLDYLGEPTYNATKRLHEGWQNQDLGEVVHTYDRIDWFSHMVYRLALPDRDWNDDRPRTVFAMPDTHLVVKLHRPDLADFTADEVVDTPIANVNMLYYYFADFFARLNSQQNYSLFKTVSIIQVVNTPDEFSQSLVMFDSPVTDRFEPEYGSTDKMLLGWLRHEDQHRL